MLFNNYGVAETRFVNADGFIGIQSRWIDDIKGGC